MAEVQFSVEDHFSAEVHFEQKSSFQQRSSFGGNPVLVEFKLWAEVHFQAELQF